LSLIQTDEVRLTTGHKTVQIFHKILSQGHPPFWCERLTRWWSYGGDNRKGTG